MLIKRNKPRKHESVTKPVKLIRPRRIRLERISGESASDLFLSVVYNLITKGLDVYEIDENHVTIPVTFNGKAIADILINRRCLSTFDMQNCHVDVLYYDYAELVLEYDALYDAIDDGCQNVPSIVNWIEDNLSHEIMSNGYDLRTERDVTRMILDIKNLVLQIQTGFMKIDEALDDYKWQMSRNEKRMPVRRRRR